MSRPAPLSRPPNIALRLEQLEAQAASLTIYTRHKAMGTRGGAGKRQRRTPKPPQWSGATVSRSNCWASTNQVVLR